MDSFPWAPKHPTSPRPCGGRAPRLTRTARGAAHGLRTGRTGPGAGQEPRPWRPTFSWSYAQWRQPLPQQTPRRAEASSVKTVKPVSGSLYVSKPLRTASACTATQRGARRPSPASPAVREAADRRPRRRLAAPAAHCAAARQRIAAACRIIWRAVARVARGAHRQHGARRYGTFRFSTTPTSRCDTRHASREFPAGDPGLPDPRARDTGKSIPDHRRVPNIVILVSYRGPFPLARDTPQPLVQLNSRERRSRGSRGGRRRGPAAAPAPRA